MIQLKDYLHTLLTEKGISDEHIFTIKSDSLYGNHIVPLDVIIEFIENLDPITQGKIRETLVTKPGIQTLRTAAFVGSIDKIAVSYMNLGIWP